MLPKQLSPKDRPIPLQTSVADVNQQEEVGGESGARHTGPILQNFPMAPRPENSGIYTLWQHNPNAIITTTTTAATAAATTTTTTTTTTSTATATAAYTANQTTITQMPGDDIHPAFECPDCYIYDGVEYASTPPLLSQRSHVGQFPSRHAPISVPSPYPMSVFNTSNSSGNFNNPPIPQRFLRTQELVEYPIPQMSNVQQFQARRPESGGHAMIFAAAAIGDLAQLRSLCRTGASVNATDYMGSTPLHYAVRAGNRRMIADLMDMGANVHAENHDKNTAVDLAFENKRYDIVLQLVRAGAQMADVHVDSHAIMTDLIRKGEVELVKLLITANARTDVRDPEGRTYLHLAVLAKNIDMIKLFSLPALVAADDNDQNTPLHLAVAMQEPALVRVVLNASPPLNAINRVGLSPALLACNLVSNISLIQLLQAGCDPNLPDPAGNTPLHVACIKRSSAHVSVLISAKANLAAFNLAGKTPLELLGHATDGEGIFIANLLRVSGSPQ